MDPVRMDAPDLSGIDPTLDACCRREVESNRRQTALEATLRRHDRVALAERRRRHVVDGLSFGSGCRCCYDPGTDGGEYFALNRARARLAEEGGGVDADDEDEDDREEEGGGGEAGGGASSEPALGSVSTKPTADSDSDSDDDSEFDYLLDEDLPGGGEGGGGGSALAELEAARRAELEMAALEAEGAQQHGFGCHRQMHPGRVLHAAGLGMNQRGVAATVAPAVVLHLYDPESDLSASLDLFLESKDMAGTYRGTKFLRGNGRSALMTSMDLAAQVLPRLRPDSDVPALVAIADGSVVAFCPNLEGLGTASDGTIEPRAVEEFLDRAGVLRRDPPPFEDLCRIRPEEMMLMESMAREKAAMAKAAAPPEEFYNCGVEGCNKTFRHDHVGITNERQGGRLVSEEETLGRE